MERKEAAQVAASSLYRVISKDRFGGFTAFHWDGTCLTISRKHRCYKSYAFTYDTIALNDEELLKLKEFLIYGSY